MENGIYKVLIVDDSASAIESLKEALSNYPELHLCGVAMNAAKGEKLIFEHQPDLLFLDVELPDNSGLEFFGEIRVEITWNMKVVFYTAYDKYVLAALRESAFDFLLKPFSSDELETVLNRFRKSMITPPSFPSFASSVSCLLPRRDAFMIGTVTGYKMVRMEEIGYFEHVKSKRQWQVALFNGSKLFLRNSTTAEDIVGYSKLFMQISQSAIININYLAGIRDKQCLLYPPFNECTDLLISRTFLKELQEKICFM